MLSEQSVIEKINGQRASMGFLGIDEMLALTDRGNIFLDPFSILLSRSVEIGDGNVFFPNLVLQTANAGSLTIADKNTFFPNTIVIADKGKINIGSSNQFGDGGCSIKANTTDSDIRIGDKGRFLGGAVILGKSVLGSGSQILGPITAQDCELRPGGNFESEDPDERAGVLKGNGVARGIIVEVGKVLNGAGKFDQADIELQSVYHPKS